MQRGTWIYEQELGGHKSTLRRKKAAWKLLSFDHNEFIKIKMSMQRQS